MVPMQRRYNKRVFCRTFRFVYLSFQLIIHKLSFFFFAKRTETEQKMEQFLNFSIPVFFLFELHTIQSFVGFNFFLFVQNCWVLFLQNFFSFLRTKTREIKFRNRKCILITNFQSDISKLDEKEVIQSLSSTNREHSPILFLIISLTFFSFKVQSINDTTKDCGWQHYEYIFIRQFSTILCQVIVIANHSVLKEYHSLLDALQVYKSDAKSIVSETGCINHFN